MFPGRSGPNLSTPASAPAGPAAGPRLAQAANRRDVLASVSLGRQAGASRSMDPAVPAHHLLSGAARRAAPAICRRRRRAAPRRPRVSRARTGTQAPRSVLVGVHLEVPEPVVHVGVADEEV